MTTVRPLARRPEPLIRPAIVGDNREVRGVHWMSLEALAARINGAEPERQPGRTADAASATATVRR